MSWDRYSKVTLSKRGKGLPLSVKLQGVWCSRVTVFGVILEKCIACSAYSTSMTIALSGLVPFSTPGFVWLCCSGRSNTPWDWYSYRFRATYVSEAWVLILCQLHDWIARLACVGICLNQDAHIDKMNGKRKEIDQRGSWKVLKSRRQGREVKTLSIAHKNKDTAYIVMLYILLIRDHIHLPWLYIMSYICLFIPKDPKLLVHFYLPFFLFIF